MAQRFARQKRIGEYYRTGNGIRSQRVDCMDGDVANLSDIEGIDFTVVNQDLIEYIANTFH